MGFIIIRDRKILIWLLIHGQAVNPVTAAVWAYAVCTVHIKSRELYSQQETALVYVLLHVKEKSAGYAYLQAYAYISTAYQRGQSGSFVRRQKGISQEPEEGKRAETEERQVKIKVRGTDSVS